MVLQPSAFPNGFVAFLHAVGWALILPCFWALDRLIALCKSTTLERSKRVEQECYLHPLKVLFGSVAFFLLFLVAAPVAFLGLLLWAPLQSCRRPFHYHVEQTGSPEREIHRGFEQAGKASFGFATANLCLLPDSLARFNNLGNTQRRASAIGRRIAQGICRPHIRIFVDSPSSCSNLTPSNSILPGGNSSTYGATDRQTPPVSQNPHSAAECAPLAKSSSTVVCVPCEDVPEAPDEHAAAHNSNQNSNQQSPSSHRSAPRALLAQGLHPQDGVPWEVSPLFPANVDVLCLEEVFDKRAAKKLLRELKPVFGHILYDVGVYACQPPCCCSSFKFFNSGIFVASRFPILEAQYHCFPNSRGEDALAAKGLLSIKVALTPKHASRFFLSPMEC